MINYLLKITNRLKNLNYIAAIKIFFYVLIGNNSKYPIYLKKFEKKISKKFRSKYALTFSSGTAAFYASILSLQLNEGSNILASRMTFPSVLNVLKILNYKINFFDVDKNFQPIIEDIDIDIDIDLIVVTHPFGFFCNFQKLDKFKSENTKLIFDSSHAQGLKYKEKFLNEYSDISFFSIQGQKAITGGEGGIILTDDHHAYKRMINLHHPGHDENKYSTNYTGVSRNLKLRMHPIASLIADESVSKFEKRNKLLINKYIKIYEFLKKFKKIILPSIDNDISGFHYGLPFYYELNKDKIIWPILKYNWPIYANNNLDINQNIKDDNIYNKLYFIDLNFIKNNSLNFIFRKLNVIFKNDL